MSELNKYQAALPHLQRCLDELKQVQAKLGWIDDNDISNWLRHALGDLESAIRLMETKMGRVWD